MPQTVAADQVLDGTSVTPWEEERPGSLAGYAARLLGRAFVVEALLSHGGAERRQVSHRTLQALRVEVIEEGFFGSGVGERAFQPGLRHQLAQMWAVILPDGGS